MAACARRRCRATPPPPLAGSAGHHVQAHVGLLPLCVACALRHASPPLPPLLCRLGTASSPSYPHASPGLSPWPPAATRHPHLSLRLAAAHHWRTCFAPCSQCSVCPQPPPVPSCTPHKPPLPRCAPPAPPPPFRTHPCRATTPRQAPPHPPATANVPACDTPLLHAARRRHPEGHARGHAGGDRGQAVAERLPRGRHHVHHQPRHG